VESIIQLDLTAEEKALVGEIRRKREEKHPGVETVRSSIRTVPPEAGLKTGPQRGLEDGGKK